MKRLLILITVFLLGQSVMAQVEKHEEWKKERAYELTKEDGWINLIALIWMDENQVYLNQIGKDSLALGDQILGKNVGKFEFHGDSVWFVYNPKISKKARNQSPEKTLVYPLEYGKGGGAYFDRWKWTVIQRGGQYGVRLRDLSHPGVKDFHGLPYYDYNPDFRVKAFFEPKFNQTMEIPNVLGQIIEWKVMGILKFEIDGKPLELTVLDELGKFFVIFADKTNGLDTYPTGRYMYVDYPDRTGNTLIDFNFSYNPPCAFTSFATCPIPPKVNRMDVEILAGEKAPEGH